jgi:hypothetical protein
MAEPSPGEVLRQLNQAQNGMRKARQSLPLVRDGAIEPRNAIRAGWESLQAAHRVLAGVPLGAANDDVMARQIAAQRYATALLVRLRRLVRKGPGALEDLDEAGEDE